VSSVSASLEVDHYKKILEYIDLLWKGIQVIKRYQRKDLDVLASFANEMSQTIRQNRLPNLLRLLAGEVEISREPSQIANSPELSKVLDVTPAGAAGKRFNLLYVLYHLERHQGDYDAAAKAVGLGSGKTLKQKHKRLSSQFKK
jgi:hypothetical protein